MEMSGDTATALPPRRERWGPWATLAWAVGGAAVLVASQTIGEVIYLFLSGKIANGRPLSAEDLAKDGALVAFAVLTSAPFVLGYIALAVRLARTSLVDYLALRWPRWWHIAVGVAAVAIVLFLSGAAAQASGQEIPEFMTDTFASARQAGVLPLLVLSFVVLAPLEEEILFRGFVYRGLAPALGPPLTIVLTSAVWAVVHVQYPWFYVGEIFLLGLTFGWLRWLSGSLVTSILLHIANNGLAILAMALMNSD